MGIETHVQRKENSWYQLGLDVSHAITYAEDKFSNAKICQSLRNALLIIRPKTNVVLERTRFLVLETRKKSSILYPASGAPDRKTGCLRNSCSSDAEAVALRPAADIKVTVLLNVSGNPTRQVTFRRV